MHALFLIVVGSWWCYRTARAALQRGGRVTVAD